METMWIEEKQLARALTRNEAFWTGELQGGPLMWVTVPNAKPGEALPEPDDQEKMWTDVDYYMASAERELSLTHYAGDAVPVHHPWLGPDQFAAWLGADMALKPKEFTSWVTPFVDDWDKFPELEIDPENRWWTLYLEMVRRSVQAGKGRWVTAYPDLHTGLDGLAAIRGPQNLMIDMLTIPETIHRAMKQTTALWKHIVDVVSNMIGPGGQGTSNWTMGWSRDRFLCLGQNDFSCMIGPEMFDAFCCQDGMECTGHVERTLYHLDGPDAIRHLPRILEWEALDCIQWIQGAGNPHPSQWLDLLKRIQDAGKSVQLMYTPSHGSDADFGRELEILCSGLDADRLFIVALLDSVEKADALVALAARPTTGT